MKGALSYYVGGGQSTDMVGGLASRLRVGRWRSPGPAPWVGFEGGSSVEAAGTLCGVAAGPPCRPAAPFSVAGLVGGGFALWRPLLRLRRCWGGTGPVACAAFCPGQAVVLGSVLPRLLLRSSASESPPLGRGLRALRRWGPGDFPRCCFLRRVFTLGAVG